MEIVGTCSNFESYLIDRVQPRPCMNRHAIKGNRNARIDLRWKDLHNEQQRV